MARYGQAYKDRIVARLLPPESAAVEAVSREVGVRADTLERWRAQALAGAAGGVHRWTAAARLEAVIATAAMDEAARGAWCRERGVYAADLDAWKRDAIAGLGEPRAASAVEARQDRRRVKELEREPRRKDEAPAEAAALPVLSKEVAAILHGGEAERPARRIAAPWPGPSRPRTRPAPGSPRPPACPRARCGAGRPAAARCCRCRPPHASARPERGGAGAHGGTRQ